MIGRIWQSVSLMSFAEKGNNIMTVKFIHTIKGVQASSFEELVNKINALIDEGYRACHSVQTYRIGDERFWFTVLELTTEETVYA